MESNNIGCPEDWGLPDQLSPNEDPPYLSEGGSVYLVDKPLTETVEAPSVTINRDTYTRTRHWTHWGGRGGRLHGDAGDTLDIWFTHHRESQHGGHPAESASTHLTVYLPKQKTRFWNVRFQESRLLSLAQRRRA